MMNNLHTTNAEIAGNLSVLLFFNDNTRQTVDIGGYIRKHPHPQCNKYLDPKQFAAFKIENGNIVWGEDWDLIFPVEQLHQGVIE